MNLDRTIAKFIAWAGNYFWRPCPRCGRMYGGHEKSGTRTRCFLYSDTGHLACCDRPVDEEAERAACEAEHKRWETRSAP